MGVGLVKVDSMIVKRQRKSGFTLIELSIVLVIIGLIVGGVLVGRDLIHAAEIRTQVSEMEKLDTAFSTFKLKYNALAGDMADASSFGLGSHCFQTIGDHTGNGNGDGILNYNVTGGTEQDEDRKVFCHLNNAGLWPYNSGVGGSHQNVWGPYTDYWWTSSGNSIPSVNKNLYIVSSAAFIGMQPTYAVYSGFYFFYSDTTNAHNMGLSHTPLDASAIDTKMDDGAPNSGKVRAWGQDGFAATAGSAGSANCMNSDVTPNTYNTTYTAAPVCVPGFKMAVYE